MTPTFVPKFTRFAREGTSDERRSRAFGFAARAVPTATATARAARTAAEARRRAENVMRRTEADRAASVETARRSFVGKDADGAGDARAAEAAIAVRVLRQVLLVVGL